MSIEKWHEMANDKQNFLPDDENKTAHQDGKEVAFWNWKKKRWEDFDGNPVRYTVDKGWVLKNETMCRNCKYWKEDKDDWGECVKLKRELEIEIDEGWEGATLIGINTPHDFSCSFGEKK